MRGLPKGRMGGEVRKLKGRLVLGQSRVFDVQGQITPLLTTVDTY